MFCYVISLWLLPFSWFLVYHCDASIGEYDPRGKIQTCLQAKSTARHMS